MKFRYNKLHGLLISLVIAFAAYSLAGELPDQGRLALALSLLTVALWVANVFPLEITSILYSVLLVVCKVLPPPEAFSGYSNPTPWFILSVLIFGFAVNNSGLGRRLSLYLSNALGVTFKGMLMAIFAVGSILSFLTPAGVERILILYPLALAAAVAIMGEKMAGSNVTKLSMSVAYISGNTLGFGILTGTAVNILALGVINQVAGLTIYWTQWFVWFYVPINLTALISIFILVKIYPPEQTQVIGGRESIKEDFLAMGKITPQELKTAMFLLMAVLLWTTDKFHGLPPWAVGVFIATLMTAPVIGCLKAENIKAIPSNIVVVSAAAITLGGVMQATGVGEWMGRETLGRFIQPGMSTSVASAITFLTATVLHIPLVESNTTVAGFVPVVVNYFHSMGMPVVGPALMAVMAGLTIAFVPFMVIPAILMVGFGEHF
ncbi:MAG: SLC13 family permease [Spirochaetales bacterium]|jgi:sodium-dependent dicarboxylate transporter 2/3/5|nr:SLC13 family permease [Spirochaetales bacterium]